MGPHKPPQKGKFQCNDDIKEAFHTLKKVMTTTPILDMPNFNEAFTVETDALVDGIGVVLQQQTNLSPL